MTDDYWPGAEHVRQQLKAQLAVEARFPGWQVLHTPTERWVRYTKVPKGYFYAVYDRLSEAPLMAADLDGLADLVERRQQEIEAAKLWAVRSDLRGILPYVRAAMDRADGPER
jgi:hypothetical protein